MASNYFQHNNRVSPPFIHYCRNIFISIWVDCGACFWGYNNNATAAEKGKMNCVSGQLFPPTQTFFGEWRIAELKNKNAIWDWNLWCNLYEVFQNCRMELWEDQSRILPGCQRRLTFTKMHSMGFCGLKINSLQCRLLFTFQFRKQYSKYSLSTGKIWQMASHNSSNSGQWGCY